MKLRISMLMLVACPYAFACSDDGSSNGGQDAGTDSSMTQMDSSTEQDASTEQDSSVEEDASTEDGSVEPDASTGPVAPSVAGELVITEIHMKVAGFASDSLAEYVEVHNPSATVTYDLNGCIFADADADTDFTFSAQLLVPPGAYIVLAPSASTVLTHSYVADGVYGTNGTGLSSGGDSPQIRCGGVTIDKVAYNNTDFPVAEPPGEGAMQYPGYSMQLGPTHLTASANDTGANWCRSSQMYIDVMPGVEGGENYGTPRAANSACP